MRLSIRVNITAAIAAVTDAKMMYSVLVLQQREDQGTEKAAGDGDNLKQHAQFQVHDTSRRAARRDGVGRRDHRHQADAGRGLQRQSQTDVQQGDEEDASANAEQRAEGSRDRTRHQAHDDGEGFVGGER